MERIKSIPALKTAILLVDVQNSEIDHEHQEKFPWYYQQITEVCLPNMKEIIQLGRSLGIEIMYTTIESLTSDGRDRSLDHKLSNIFIPKNSYLGKVIDDIAPAEDDIWLKKTSSGVFNSTNIDYILRNLERNYLVVMGMLTDQCVDMAVRDAADKGYNVICINDACTTHTLQRHENALKAFSGYCTIMNTQQFIQQLKGYLLVQFGSVRNAFSKRKLKKKKFDLTCFEEE
jgi:nicotinamidase-related amidase